MQPKARSYRLSVQLDVRIEIMALREFVAAEAAAAAAMYALAMTAHDTRKPIAHTPNRHAWFKIESVDRHQNQ